MFEFDEQKSRANLAKHGIDFHDAQRLWDDPNLIETQLRTADEPRWLVVAQLSDRFWAAVITWRGDTLRLISVRRARQREVARYESQGA
jgi:uncharacterized DUF497 family protein